MASKLEVEIDDIEKMKQALDRAIKIVDNSNAGEVFIAGIKQSIKNAMDKGLVTESDIDALILQICYRVSDFGFLLNEEDKSISDYDELLKA